MKFGTFVSVISQPVDPVEFTYQIDKKFTDEIYKFILSSPISMKEYFDNKQNYESKGMYFDLDTVELFVKHHVCPQK